MKADSPEAGAGSMRFIALIKIVLRAPTSQGKLYNNAHKLVCRRRALAGGHVGAARARYTAMTARAP